MAETPYRLEYYLDDNGKAPFLEWLYSLRDKSTQNKDIEAAKTYWKRQKEE